MFHLTAFEPSFPANEAIWRYGKAGRFAVLHDAACYFGALRSALLGAQSEVFIVGWDLHSETRLVGPSGTVDDGLPETLGPFLRALIHRNARLQIRILTWDFAVIYAIEREAKDPAIFTQDTDGRLAVHFDDCLPLGSAQHQKFVCVDRSVAFLGGLDLTIRRWDTTRHRPRDPLRCDPAGEPYPPFHDVQCMADGEVAATLSELALQRWTCASAEECPAVPARDGWPADVAPQVRDVHIAVARTQIAARSLPRVNEVERLFDATIARAERFIYIENQFISAGGVAASLAKRMAATPSLEVLIVTPRIHASWIESQAMQDGRTAFLAHFAAAGVADRVRFYYPAVRTAKSETPVMVHSKVMVVDDRYFRIGSANLNNRSMGADSECDLLLEAASQDHIDFIANWRRDLIAHFCGVTREDIRDNEADLLGYLERHAQSPRAEKLFRPIDTQADVTLLASFVQPIADPHAPLHLERAADRMWKTRVLLAAGAVIAALIALSFAWSYSSFSDQVQTPLLASLVARYGTSWFAPLLAISLFVIGGLIAFPVLVLIAATAAALGPWLGFASAMAGVVASALITFGIGRLIGQKRLQNLLGPRMARLQQRVATSGIIAVVIMRMVPLAPFSIVNIIAGATTLRLRDFLIGTGLGMAPGIVTMAALGSQIADVAKDASWANILLLLLALAAWLAICFGAQFVATWLSGRRNR